MTSGRQRGWAAAEPRMKPMQCAMSSTDPVQLYSYSIALLPSNFCRGSADGFCL